MSILLIHCRRGLFSLTLCQDCGHTWDCFNCSAKLITYESEKVKRLICHQCQSSYSYPTKCPSCNSRNILSKFGGVEELVRVLQQEFGYSPLRFDSDQTKIQPVQSDSVGVSTRLFDPGIDYFRFDQIIFLAAENLFASSDYLTNEEVYKSLAEVFLAARNDSEIIFDTRKTDLEFFRSLTKLAQKLDNLKIISTELANFVGNISKENQKEFFGENLTPKKNLTNLKNETLKAQTEQQNEQNEQNNQKNQNLQTILDIKKSDNSDVEEKIPKNNNLPNENSVILGFNNSVLDSKKRFLSQEIPKNCTKSEKSENNSINSICVDRSKEKVSNSTLRNNFLTPDLVTKNLAQNQPKSSQKNIYKNFLENSELENSPTNPDSTKNFENDKSDSNKQKFLEDEKISTENQINLNNLATLNQTRAEIIYDWYNELMSKESDSRQNFRFPPFTNLLLLTTQEQNSSKSLENLAAVSNYLATLQTELPEISFGKPYEAKFLKRKNKFSHHLLVRYPRQYAKFSRLKTITQWLSDKYKLQIRLNPRHLF